MIANCPEHGPYEVRSTGGCPEPVHTYLYGFGGSARLDAAPSAESAELIAKIRFGHYRVPRDDGPDYCWDCTECVARRSYPCDVILVADALEASQREVAALKQQCADAIALLRQRVDPERQ